MTSYYLRKMKMKIPQTRGRKLKSSKKLVNEILLNGNCRILKRVKIKGKGVKIEAEKPLKNGRLHIRVSNPDGHYTLDIHFDPAKHFDILQPPPKIIRDCEEIRDFIKECAIPVLKKYRPNYSLSLAVER